MLSRTWSVWQFSMRSCSIVIMSFHWRPTLCSIMQRWLCVGMVPVEWKIRLMDSLALNNTQRRGKSVITENLIRQLFLRT